VNDTLLGFQPRQHPTGDLEKGRPSEVKYAEMRFRQLVQHNNYCRWRRSQKPAKWGPIARIKSQAHQSDGEAFYDTIA